MKLIAFTFSLLIFQLTSFGQSPKIFDIKEITISNSSHNSNLESIKQKDYKIFEDEKYVITGTCRGEWGGSVYFQNKKTKKIHQASASCPVMINKINNIYIVTASLAHLSGFSKIIQVDDSEKMDASPATGMKVLLDTVGISTICSFPFNDELYHVINDRGRTSIAKIVNKKFKLVQLLSEKSLYTMSSNVTKRKDGHLIASFQTDQTEGYLDIFQNKIDVIYYPVKPATKTVIKHF